MSSSSSVCSLNSLNLTNNGHNHVEDQLLIDSRQRMQDSSPVRDVYHEVCRGVISEGESFDYSGYYYRNAFKVTGGNILLHTLGFFGPVSHKIVKYKVIVYIETPTFAPPYPSYYNCCGEPQSPRRIFSEVRKTVIAEKDKMFYVSFNPVLIQPEDGWVQITFGLYLEKDEANKRERTHFTHKKNLMGRMKQGKQVDEVTTEVPFGFRRFTFAAGSCQMPILRFNIP